VAQRPVDLRIFRIPDCHAQPPYTKLQL
jgi:hypothetical protein